MGRHDGRVPVHVNKRLVIPDAELEWQFTTSGGPGGQHANKASTRVELTWNIVESTVVSDRERARLRARLGDVARVVADDTRSQHRNRSIALDRLGERCRAALAPPPKKRTPTKPSRRAKQRRLDAKRRHAQTKRLRQRPGRDD